MSQGEFFNQLSDEEVLAYASKIAEKRLNRYGRVDGPLSAAGLVKHIIGHELHEKFLVVYLDSQHQVIENRVEFTGTIDGASVYPRTIAERALRNGAAAVVFAHNHPSGVCEPSDADIQITKRLIEALGLLDIRVLDHIIVSSTSHTSLRDRGLI